MEAIMASNEDAISLLFKGLKLDIKNNSHIPDSKKQKLYKNFQIKEKLAREKCQEGLSEEDAIEFVFENVFDDTTLDQTRIESIMKEYINSLENISEINSAWFASMIIICLKEVNKDNNNSCIIRCKEWLLSHKIDDCKWDSKKYSPGIPNIYDTSFAVVALLRAGITSDSEIIKSAIRYIKTSMHPYKAWSPTIKDDIDVGSTSWAIIALREANEPNDSKYIIGPANWLINYGQHQDGGWGCKWKKDIEVNSSITRTYDAVNALLIAGFDPESNIIKNAMEFLIEQQGLVMKKKVGCFAWPEEFISCGIIMNCLENTSCAEILLLDFIKSQGDKAIINDVLYDIDSPIVKAGISWIIDYIEEKEFHKIRYFVPRMLICLNKYCKLKSNEISGLPGIN